MAYAVRKDKITTPWYHFSLTTMIKGCSLSFTQGEQFLLGREGACSLTQDFLGFVSLPVAD